MIRGALIATAILSALLFPYPYTVLLTVIASVAFPPTGLLVGVLVDALYYTGTGLPLGLLMGLGASIFGFVVHRFVKARIMDA